MKTSKLFTASSLLTIVVGLLAITASADAATSFGPVESRAFHFRSGATAIETVGKDCAWNLDWLMVKGPGVGSKKSIDVSPALSAKSNDSWFPSSGCSAPDCVQVLVKVTSHDAAGTRTVTLNHPDGRKITTTFDVVENSTGRCDAPKGKQN